MVWRHVIFVSVFLAPVFAIYPFFDTQDFIYNVPKVFRISVTLDKLLDYYEKTPSKDPEFFISVNLARGQMKYTITELDKAVPAKLKENLENLTRRMDRIIEKTQDLTKFMYRSKEYEYIVKTIVSNMGILSTMMEPLIIGTMGTQNPYKITFEQYLEETRTKMPIRKAADACTMHLLMSVADAQASKKEQEQCDLSPECTEMIMKGSALGFQQTARIVAAQLARSFECIEQVDMQAYIYKLCMHVYKETKSLEAWDHPPGTRTLFMQQIFYCASQGYGEFIKPRWMNKIISWQEAHGCYADDRHTFMKLSGFISPTIKETNAKSEREETYRIKKAAQSEGAACNSMASAMALGSLTIFVRALLETDGSFVYEAVPT